MAIEFSKLFEYELSIISDKDVRDLTSYIFDNKVPDYFLSNFSSSSGKFHPLDKNGNRETLIQHSKSVFRLLYIMLNHPFIKEKMDDVSISICLSAALLHDCVKYGYYEVSDHTVHEHPVLVKYLIDDKILSNNKWVEIFNKITYLISAHHGPWRTSSHSEINLPPIETEDQWYLHLADYIASRECVRIDYDYNNLR